MSEWWWQRRRTMEPPGDVEEWLTIAHAKHPAQIPGWPILAHQKFELLPADELKIAHARLWYFLGTVHQVKIDSETVSETTTSTTYVDSALSINITTGASVLLIMTWAMVLNSGAYDTRFAIYLDDAEKCKSWSYGTTAQVNAMQWAEEVAAGDHTVKVKKSVSGGTGTYYDRVLIVIEIKD